MHKVFIDTNIIIDLISKRNPFYKSAAQVFTLADSGKISAFTSPITFSNLHYILSKQESREIALESLLKLRLLVKVLNTGEKIVDLALASKFKDFEDGIQYYTALENGIDFLITRNKKDFVENQISIVDAEEYLKLYQSEKI